MALTAPVLLQFLLSNRASGGFAFFGAPYDLLASGIANGVVQWGVNNPMNLALKGVSVGAAGVGIIQYPSSSIVVSPNVGLVVAGLTGAGVKGALALSLATAVATGISQGFMTSAQYVGTSATVGAGQDISKITTANASVLVGILNMTLRASLGSGPAISMMASGLGVGIASQLLMGTGTATITPAPGSPPPAAPTTGITSSVVV